MRLARLSFLAHALLLTAVAAQSVAVTDLVPSVTSDSSSSSDPATSADPTTSSSSSSSTSSSSSSSSSSQDQPSTTSADPTTSSSSSSSSKSTTSAENTADNTSKTTSSQNNEPSKTADGDSSSTSDSSSTTQTPVVETITSYQTVSGSTLQHVMTSTSIPASETSSPSLSGDSSSNSSSGVSSADKKIIIGVVVGVGGAIVIGVLAIVIWRIQKKRSGQYNEEDDDLMGGTAVGSGPREKAPSPSAGAQGTPFKSTLDQYHNPGPVNAASNF